MKKQVHATPEAQKFWAYCSGRRFFLQRCKDCREWRFPPGPVCPGCGSLRVDWTEASGRAELLSFATYRQNLGAVLDLPYVVILVRLAEGPRMVSRLIADPVQQLRVGMPLQLSFGPAGSNDPTLPLFTPSFSARSFGSLEPQT